MLQARKGSLQGLVLKAAYGPLFHKVWCSEHAPSTGRQRDEKRRPLSSRLCGLIESRIIKHTSYSKARLSMHVRVPALAECHPLRGGSHNSNSPCR